MDGNRGKISDRYALGEELGRGAYGQVYRGTDLLSNEVVAIKQISLAGMSQDNLQGVMGEIELLKTLNHPNIVKYIGSFKTRTHLYIILEYMENGALSAIIKPNRYGVFPETLVAVYIAQVLKGLQYLHEQGVVHRDIKGANILTTKEGLVKLADFGVAAKLGELEDRRDELQQHVVGTPYWMAPEVIEMTQVTPASDIWSVGCLIIEMLTGSPPYYDLQPMSALFRIVQDDCPPLPDNITPLMQDFLVRCFQKDPRKRPGAQDLLLHDWINMNKNTIRSSWRRNQGSLAGRGRGPANDHESVTSVISRMVALADDGVETETVPMAPLPPPAIGNVGFSPVPVAVPPVVAAPSIPRIPPPPQDAVHTAAARANIQQPVAQTPSPLRDGAMSAGGISPTTSFQPQMFGTPIMSASTSPGFTTPTQPHATAAVTASPTQPIQQFPNLLSPESLTWNAPSQPPQLDGQAAAYAQAPQAVVTMVGPITSLVSMLGGPPQPTGGQLAPWLHNADQMVSATMARQAAAGHSISSTPVSAAGYAPNGFISGGSVTDQGTDLLGPTANSALLDLRKQVRDLVKGMRPTTAAVGREPAAFPPAACKDLAALVSSSPEAKQIMMNETGALVLLELLDTDNPKYVEGAMELLLAITHQDLVTLETICLLGIVPAAAKYALPGYPASLRMRTATFLARFFNSGPSTLAHFVACQGLKQLVAMVADLPTPKPTLKPSQSPYSPTPAFVPPLSSPAASTTSSTNESPGLALSQLAINCIFQFLDCYNILPHNYLCRLLAQNGLVPRLYIVLKETLAAQRAATQAGSLSSLDKAGAAPASDSTRQLSPEEITALQDATVSLLLLLSNADTLVKGYCCTRDALQSHLECLSKLQPPCASSVRLMRALRWLTGELAMLPAIKESGAISALVPFLAAKDRLESNKLAAAQVTLEALHALCNICKFNKVHLEAASGVGITAHLTRMAAEGIQAMAAQQRAGHTHANGSGLANNKAVGQEGAEQAGGTAAGAALRDDELLDPVARWGRLRGFVVPLMIALVGASSSTRAKLWAANGPDLLLALLSDQESVELGVPGALDLWLSEDHARMEPKLTQKESVAQLVSLYHRIAHAQDKSLLPALLSVLRAMIGRSSKLAVALAIGPVGIVPSLLAMLDSAGPILRVKILEILRCLYEHYPRPKEFLLLHKIPDVLRRLLETGGRGSDAVHQEAQRLLTAFQINVLF